MPSNSPVCAVLMAGGQSRRMGGGDKCLRDLAGQPLLSYIVDTAKSQADRVIINANGDPSRFDTFGLTVVPDVVEGNVGPLAGVLTGLMWARQHMPDCQWVASLPCDAPFAPKNLVDRFLAAIDEVNADMACASSGGRDHPVFGLWPVRLAGALSDAIREDGVRKVDEWTGRYPLARAIWETNPVDPFFNVNRPDDLAVAEALLTN